MLNYFTSARENQAREVRSGPDRELCQRCARDALQVGGRCGKAVARRAGRSPDQGKVHQARIHPQRTGVKMPRRCHSAHCKPGFGPDQGRIRPLRRLLRRGASGQSPDACYRGRDGICAPLGRAQCPTARACSTRCSPAPSLRLMTGAIAAGAAWRVRRRSGRGETVNVKLTRAANPLIPNDPDHVLQRAALLLPSADPPGPGHPPLPESRRQGQPLPQTTPHRGHPMTVRRLPCQGTARPGSMRVPPAVRNSQSMGCRCPGTDSTSRSRPARSPLLPRPALRSVSRRPFRAGRTQRRPRPGPRGPVPGFCSSHLPPVWPETVPQTGPGRKPRVATG